MKRVFRAGSFRHDPSGEVRAELQAHLEMEVESLMSRGMTEQEARAEARRLLGDLERYEGQARREATALDRRQRWADVLDSWLHDLRYALRRMSKNPAFTTVAILSLALGIGANTAIFSIVNTVLMGGVPMQATEELVDIYTSEQGKGYPYGVSSVPDLMDLRTRTDLFQGVAGYEGFLARYEAAETTDPVMGELVTHDLFAILGIEPALGRFFVPEEGENIGTHPVVVLGHAFWESRLGGDRNIVGQDIRLGGTLFTVVGVAPKELQSLTAPGFTMDLWAPYQMAPALSIDGEGYELDDRYNHTVFIRARLRDGSTVDQVRAALGTMSAQNQAAFPDQWRGREFNVLPTDEVAIHPLVDGPLKGAAALLLTFVGLVLLVACINLAGFLLARASDRKKEIALRLALGARRRALIRQLLVETLALGLVGGTVGLIVATWVLQALVSFQPPIPFPLNLEFALDGRVLLFTGLVSAAAGLSFGLIPALQSTNPDVAPTLKSDVRATPGGRKHFTTRNGLIVIQVAISMILLLGAGLFIRSVRSAQGMDLGFSARDGAIAWVMPGMSGMDRESHESLVQRLEARILAIPGVTQVATTEMVPLGVGLHSTSWDVPGVDPPAGQEHLSIRYTLVSGTYFDVMGIPVVDGRAFSENDQSESERVAIVSETTAQRYWPDETAVGKEIRRVGQEVPYRIVGVVKDTKVWTLGEDIQPFVYLARSQGSPAGANIIARGSIPDAEIAGQLRQVIREVESQLVIMETKTMGEHLSVQLFPPRAASALLGVFGFLALVLATTGLYGTVAFSVSRRVKEMGIRMSLGAEARGVVGMVFRGAIGPVAVGGIVGIALGLGLARAVRGFLYGTSALDPVTFLGVPAVLVAAASLAAYLPARRAGRVDPVEALRSQ